MKSFFLWVLLAVSATAQFTINTPTEGGTSAGAAECQPLLLTFSGGTPPYIITVEADSKPFTIAVFNNVGGTQITWPAVNASLGTQLLLKLEDSTGAATTSSTFPVTAGSDSCLSSSSGGNGGSSGTGSSTSTHTSSSSSSQTHPPATQSSSNTAQSSSNTAQSSSNTAQSSSNTDQSSSNTNQSSPTTNRSSSSARQSSPSANQSSTSTSPPSSHTSLATKKKNSLAGPIAGGVIGGSIVVLGGLLLWRTRRRSERRSNPVSPYVLEEQKTSAPPSGEAQSSSIPAQLIPRGIKTRRTATDRIGSLQQEIRELQELADASTNSSTNRTESSNTELRNEIQMLREQMYALEQRIQTQPSTGGTEEPPEYTQAP